METTEDFMRNVFLLPIMSITLALSGCTIPNNNRDNLYSRHIHEPEHINLLSRTVLDSAPRDLGDGSAQVNSIIASGGLKGEYESTSEFEKRISPYVPPAASFTIPMNGSWFKYDPDSGELSIKLYLENAETSGYKVTNSSYSTKTYFPALPSSVTGTETGTYEGQNAFGAKATVTKFSAKKILLVIGQISSPTGAIVAEISGKVSIPPAEMKTAASNLSLRLYGRSSHPYLTSSSLYNEATIYNTQESFSRIYFIKVDPTKIELINNKTGAVLSSNLSATAIRY